MCTEFRREKYAIDAASVRASDNGQREPNKWFSIVRGMIMYERDLSRDCAALSLPDEVHRPTF